MSNNLKTHSPHHHLLAKKLCKLASTLFLAGALFSTNGCVTPPKTSFDDYEKHTKEKTAPEYPVDCAILVSAPKAWYEYLRIPLEPIYENIVASALKENINIHGYTITYNACKQDLENVLRDPAIQTIVVTGHGEWNEWSIGKDEVTEYGLKRFMHDNNLPKKHGLFIRHTCGIGRYRSPPNPLLDKKYQEAITATLAQYGATNITIDDTWNDDDRNFGTPRSRITYDLCCDSRRETLEKNVNFWNTYINALGTDDECEALGTSVVDDPTKTRGYEGVITPLTYLLNPIPEPNSNIYKQTDLQANHGTHQNNHD